MSEEERADILANDLIDRGMVPILTKEARDILREAIREAQASARDDALEEAAVMFEAEGDRFEAAAIRNLKSKQEG